MIGTLSEEFEVNVPAHEAWALYGKLEFTYICVPDLFDKVDVLKGDGGPGTILQPFTKPGLLYKPSLDDKVGMIKAAVSFNLGMGTGTLFYTYEDEISRVDDENMVKEVRAHKGGYLSLGFNSYGVRFEVIKKSENSCTTKVTVHYDVKEGFISNTSYVSIEPFTALVKYSNNYLINNHKK